MTGASIWCVGGEDSRLRIPFMLALARLGFRVTAVGSGSGEPFRREGLPYLRYTLDRFFNPLADLRSLRELRRGVRARHPDVVHGFDTKPSLLAPLALDNGERGRAVRTINGMGWVFSPGSALARTLRPGYRALQRYVASRTAMTVFQNEEDRDYFIARHLVRPGATRLIPGSGVDVAGFDAATPSPAERRLLRAALEVEGKRVVLCVSRITRQKGIPTLLAAAEYLVREPDIAVLLVGPRESEGPLAVPKAALDRAVPAVRVLGARDDVSALLALADVFVLPTEYREGVPRVLLEAGLARCPIVTTRLAGCTRVVRDGWNGRLVPPGDPKALAEAIQSMLGDREQARAMGARTRALVEREFSLGKVVADYADVYSDVLRDPGTAGDPTET